MGRFADQDKVPESTLNPLSLLVMKEPMYDPVYYSGTFGARMVILMHELAHKIGLPYEEFPDDQFDQNQSEKYTLKIIQLCRDAIKDIAKKWHEKYSEIPK